MKNLPVKKMYAQMNVNMLVCIHFSTKPLYDDCYDLGTKSSFAKEEDRTSKRKSRVRHLKAEVRLTTSAFSKQSKNQQRCEESTSDEDVSSKEYEQAGEFKSQHKTII